VPVVRSNGEGLYVCLTAFSQGLYGYSFQGTAQFNDARLYSISFRTALWKSAGGTVRALYKTGTSRATYIRLRGSLLVLPHSRTEPLARRGSLRTPARAVVSPPKPPSFFGGLFFVPGHSSPFAPRPQAPRRATCLRRVCPSRGRARGVLASPHLAPTGPSALCSACSPRCPAARSAAPSGSHLAALRRRGCSHAGTRPALLPAGRASRCAGLLRYASAVLTHSGGSTAAKTAARSHAVRSLSTPLASFVRSPRARPTVAQPPPGYALPPRGLPPAVAGQTKTQTRTTATVWYTAPHRGHHPHSAQRAHPLRQDRRHHLPALGVGNPPALETLLSLLPQRTSTAPPLSHARARRPLGLPTHQRPAPQLG
jgi:hypothetical protein